MNVSREADAAFMRLLKIEDPKRYANLVRNMELAARRQAVTSQSGPAICQNPKCDKGPGGEPNDLLRFRAGTMYCSESCKKQSQRVLDSQKAA